MKKTILQEYWSCSMRKTARKNTKYSRNEAILKIGHLAKDRGRAKAVAFKKHQIFEKGENFENRPSFKGYSACKGYSLCKIVSLGQKLKIPKTCKREFYKNITVALYKKQLEKTPINRKLRQFSKSAILQRL